MENEMQNKKLRILCLHGYRTSGVILQKPILEKWPQSLLDQLDLVFMDGPYPAQGEAAVEGIFEPPFYEWFQADEEYKEFYNFEECLAKVEEFMLTHGPFDGVLGFSQGAMLTATIPGMQREGVALTKVPKVKFVIIASGAKFGSSKFGIPKLASASFKIPIITPSLHLIGETDVIKEGGIDLLEAFVDPIVIYHPNGHTIPTLATIHRGLLFIGGKKNCCSSYDSWHQTDGSDQDARYTLSKLLQRGTVAEYESEFLMLIKRVTGISKSLLKSFYISRLKPLLQCALLRLAPTTLGEAFSIARIMDARFEAIAEKEQNIKEKVDTTLSLPSDEASPMVKGRLHASQDTFLFLRSEDPNFKIQENGVKYVRALNVVPLEVVFTGPVDEVSSVIEDVDIDESNVKGMHVRDKFAEFFEDKGSMENVLSATKLPKGGNSHSTYSPYHLEDKVNFEGMGNITPWATKVGRRKKVKCYVQGSGRRKRKKVIRRGSGRRFVMGWDNHHTYLLSRICV
ncbi:serine hydrolase FSH [Tanacetum coccineum]